MGSQGDKAAFLSSFHLSHQSSSPKPLSLPSVDSISLCDSDTLVQSSGSICLMLQSSQVTGMDQTQQSIESSLMTGH